MMVWSEKRYCQKIWRTSIDALNDLHSRHGHDEVSKCTVCVSQTAESTLAKHFQPYQDRIEELEQLVRDCLEDETVFDTEWDKEARRVFFIFLDRRAHLFAGQLHKNTHRVLLPRRVEQRQ